MKKGVIIGVIGYGGAGARVLAALSQIEHEIVVIPPVLDEPEKKLPQLAVEAFLTPFESGGKKLPYLADEIHLMPAERQGKNPAKGHEPWRKKYNDPRRK